MRKKALLVLVSVMKQTQAIEILTKAKCAFEVLSFKAVDFTAQEVVEKLQIPAAQVFKTLVLESDKKEFAMALLSSEHELNLKKVATVWGCKRCDLAAISEMQRLTGYLKGGCSPLGSKKRLPVFIDNTANNFEWIVVSAGQRGLQIRIAAKDLAKEASAIFAELV